MTLACVPLDGDAGVVLRLAVNADCAAQALGSGGFQAMIGGPVAAGLLSALVTIFVAVIGYRLVLGTTPTMDEGVGKVLRLGFVLALVTGWPAFQTLVYRTATEAPDELTAVVMPAAGLSSADLSYRVQQVYDAMRLGANGDPRAGDPQQTAQPGAAVTPQTGRAPATAALPGNAAQPGLGALPQTASAFAVATIGTISALHLAIGILLAIAPLAILALLFDGTLGLFNGWLRALVGTALAGLAATIVTAVALIPIEQEVVRQQGWRGGSVFADIDPQALPTLVLATGIAMLVATLAAIRMGGAIRYAPRPGERRLVHRSQERGASFAAPAMLPPSADDARRSPVLGRDRATGVAEALATTVRREQGAGGGMRAEMRTIRGGAVAVAAQDQTVPIRTDNSAVTRRTALRGSRTAARRDGMGR